MACARARRANPPGYDFHIPGLVLGAGTVLVPVDGPCRLHSLQGGQARVLALLSAAYGRAVAPSVLGNIQRAARSWWDGEECLAHIDLARSRLQAPSDVQAAAYRLFVAENAMKAGLSPSAVFQALNIDRSYIDAVEKAYNPAEPRVPAGSGRTSGEWTDSEQTSGAGNAGEREAEEKPPGSSLARPPLPAASFLGELTAAQVVELGVYALRILGPAGAAVAAFGLLLFLLPTMSVSKAKCRRYRGSATRGIATKRCFVSRTTIRTQDTATSQHSWKATCFATRRDGCRLHMIVPGGGLSFDGKKWLACSAGCS
jgi:hypothetical protein